MRVHQFMASMLYRAVDGGNDLPPRHDDGTVFQRQLHGAECSSIVSIAFFLSGGVELEKRFSRLDTGSKEGNVGYTTHLYPRAEPSP